MAENIFLLGAVLDHNKYTEHALYMLQRLSATALRYTHSFAFWSMLLQRYAWGPKTTILTGENGMANLKELQQRFFAQCFHNAYGSKKHIIANY